LNRRTVTVYGKSSLFPIGVLCRYLAQQEHQSPLFQQLSIDDA
jgi:hypothetical protein